MGKILQDDKSEVSDQVTMVTRDQFIDRAADKAVRKIIGPRVKQTRIAWENRVLEREFQREEEREDTLLKEVIRMEIGNNFSLFTMWACRYGDEEARHRQRVYVAKLNRERERIVQVRRLREQQGLRSRDIVERIRAVREVNAVIEGVRDLSLNPPVVPPVSTRGRLMTLIKERLEARAARPVITRGSSLDPESALY